MDNFIISNDPSDVDVIKLHNFLAYRSYWAKNIPLQTVEQSIRGSLCFSLLEGNNFIGFARTITDRSTFAYLADVYIEEEYRGMGLGKKIIQAVMDHPDHQDIRTWVLFTADAHELYRQFGWEVMNQPEKVMVIRGGPSFYPELR
ncbi:MAG: GNAT family N-acetyltransferase [Candidatus Heimdallarchaeota archaeon]|nr:GNAT family N-acetyltransferase [Candidatus Heimdallarchaeota archaeon]